MAIDLPLNQFGVQYTLSNDPTPQFDWFSEFNVVREFSQMINTNFYQEGYNRYSGVLGLDGLYVAVIAETWSYVGSYNSTTFQLPTILNYSIPGNENSYQMMNITNRVNAIKLRF